MASEKQRLMARGGIAVVFGATLLSTLLACKPKVVNDSELRDLNQGQLMSENTTLYSDPVIRNKIPVLIYYANDTYAPTSDDPAHVNKEALIRKIRSGKRTVGPEQDEILEQIATRIDDDWNSFRRVVDIDSRFLIQEICKANARYRMGLAVFRNFGNDVSGQKITAMDYDRPFSFTYCRDNGTAMVATTRVPYFQNDFRYQSQPLSHPYMFKKAMEEVLSRFPPAAHRYILISKAHGAREIAIGPTIGVDVREVQDQEVWSSILGGASGTAAPVLENDKATMPILENDKATMPILSTPGPIIAGIEEKLKETAKQMNASGLPYPPGVSKTDYLSALFAFGGGNPKLGMYLPIVFMEACKSDLRLSQGTWITDLLEQHKGMYAGLSMENIGYLYTSDEKGLPYNTVDFRELFGPKYSKFSDFQDAFKAYLDQKAGTAVTK
jgi:hypothetical protein